MQQIFNITETKLAINLGTFAGSADNISVPFFIPNKFVNNISQCILTVGYQVYFDYVGWGAGAFRYTQNLFTLFEIADTQFGTITCQFDTTNPLVTAFNTARNTEICFNPANFGGFPQFKASHQASIDLTNVLLIEGAFNQGYTLRDIVGRSGQFILGGTASAFFRTGATGAILAIGNVQMKYNARLDIIANTPSI